MHQQDAGLVAVHAERVLPLATAHLSDEYFYQSLPLCVIDAVFSIGVRYTGVERVVECYCRFFGLRKVRAVPHEFPPRAEQQSVTSFCIKYKRLGIDEFRSSIFDNRQRTSTRNGILKADAVYRFAEVLRSHGVDYLQDIPTAATDVFLEQDVRGIPGQTSGISLQYLWMLAGSDNFIKPDRMILRFLKAAVGREVAVFEAPDLLREATRILQIQHPDLTPRVLDHEIWKYQRAQGSPPA